MIDDRLYSCTDGATEHVVLVTQTPATFYECFQADEAMCENAFNRQRLFNANRLGIAPRFIDRIYVCSNVVVTAGTPVSIGSRKNKAECFDALGKHIRRIGDSHVLSTDAYFVDYVATEPIDQQLRQAFSIPELINNFMAKAEYVHALGKPVDGLAKKIIGLVDARYHKPILDHIDLLGDPELPVFSRMHNEFNTHMANEEYAALPDLVARMKEHYGRSIR